ncbi:GDSL esterase/lipase At5g55050-like isoform X2 [Asparagus officinalis]|uniref:GDSL esterase/lipase At5g55050-like isoform X2 n=1 Tax=Asparagus officinalis TaxID=4686 RepID=UPI00098E0F95|nr:GDSL esterase/lipase At5g55050-like isoform X2 [Asparagus officinalis]
MASKSFILLLLALLFVTCGCGTAEPQVPAIYVFGDSTMDVGNNNYLGTDAVKANFPHNGIDYPHSKPTGRFSNAYNGADFVAMNMGFKQSPPPFLALKPKHKYPDIYSGRVGANFASAGTGILDSTLCVIRRIKIERAKYLLSKSIFLISAGGNDIFDFFVQNPNATKPQVNQFLGGMISNYTSHFEALYNLGARKFAIINVPPIGCCPRSRTLPQNLDGSCVEALNNLAKAFNKATPAILNNLSSKLVGLKYSIGSSYDVVNTIITHPQAFGYEEVKSACCGIGRFHAEQPCNATAFYCKDRRTHVFWDVLHPTNKTAEIAGLAFYEGSVKYASPINFKQLVDEGVLPLENL